MLFGKFSGFCPVEEFGHRLIGQVWPASDVHRGQPAALAPAPRRNVGNPGEFAELVQAQDGPALDGEV